MADQFMQHGAFSWFELMTTDVAAAREFYSKLFGWSMEDMDMPGMPYTVVKVEGEGTGGIMPIPDEMKGMPPMWGCYVTVSDVDDTAKTAQQLGGKVVSPPRSVPDVGRMCVIQDPTGAMLSAITYSR